MRTSSHIYIGSLLTSQVMLNNTNTNLKLGQRQKILQKMCYLRMHLRKSHHQPIRTCFKVLNVFVPFLSKYYRE